MAFRPRPEIASRSRRLRRQGRPGRRAFGPAVEPMETRALLSTLWVTDPGDSGPGTLRAAILAVDADSTPDTIDFNLGGGGHQVITLASALPPITNSVTIDGTSQPGYVNNAQPITHANLPANFSPGPAWTLAQPLVEINGNGLDINILAIHAANCVVKGLVLNNLGGIYDTAIQDTVGPSRIQGNYIGTDWTGIVAMPVGIGIEATLIGGTGPGEGNLISGCRNVGISAGNSGMTVIEGNFIGTNATGTAALPNSIAISITGDSGPGGDVIGGTAPGAGNLISGNSGYGINNAQTAVVQGNMIGTDITGTVAVPNNYFGIVGGSMIGGTDPGAGNLISGTTFDTSDGNSGAGVVSDGVVEGNFIGTDITGTKAIGNYFGVYAGGGATIGGTTAAARNVIAGNTYVDLRAGTGALVQGNFLGVDVTGEVVLTQYAAIQPYGATTVGGTAPGAGNVIAGDQIAVYDPINSLFEGNKIGTNKEGTAHLGGRSFFLRETTGGNTVGGTTAGAGNLISGEAILIGPSVTGNVFQGNTIDGDILFNNGAHDNLVGGTTPGSGNIFLSDAVYLIDDASSHSSTGDAILGSGIL